VKEVYLLRAKSDDKQTLGVLVAGAGTELFVAKTLELPDRANKPNESCIPAGTYRCRWTLSPRLQRNTYEVLGVPGRTGVRIHPVNFFHQLRGCIALGAAHKDINADGKLDLIHSGETVEKFNKLMAGEDFLLIIRWLR